ncbi:thermonuclease family protein [Cognatiyoonia sediminum]|uniref:thermonuclease family protein n=1 Tax=Cognatiyoonia sediminum TaxID=1508389 RepID=UPI0009349556
MLVHDWPGFHRDDGDTIRIKHKQIHLFGIDAREIDHPYGRKSNSAFIDLCNEKDVRAEICDMDQYGRDVALCTFTDSTNLSAELVSQGLH